MLKKSALKEYCLQLVEARMASLQEYLEAIYQAKTLETKSSAGDKYETGRAMMQLEEDQLKAQLAQVEQTYRQIAQLPLGEANTSVQLGSLIRTTKRHYFLSVGLGKIEWEGVSYFCISPQAPIGQLLWGKRVGDSYRFNGQQDQILEIG